MSLLNHQRKRSETLIKSPVRFTLVLALGMCLALSIAIFASSSVRAALSCVNDTAGANDEPGQKDLTQLCVDNAGLPFTLQVTWNWDEISVTGNNTLDACSLYDTDGDGNVNFSLCVTDPTDAPISITLYTCGDDMNDRCTQPIGEVSGFSSTCSTSTLNTDPFPAGAAFPQDRAASCNVVLADVGAADAELLDVCSYPSREPNSDPSDCVIIQDNPTPTPTATLTSTPTDTPTPTNTPTDTPTNTPTDTPTNTPTDTPTNTPTDTPTNTPTNTPTDTPTNTPTDTPTNTPTFTPTNTLTPTNTATATPDFGVRTPGYWKNHYAVASQYLPLQLGSFNVDTKTKFTKVFSAMNCGSSKPNDAIGCLAGHLLAAKLNIANGSNACILPVIAQADTFLSGGSVNGVQGIIYTGPSGTYKLSPGQRLVAISLKTQLDQYNNNISCP